MFKFLAFGESLSATTAAAYGEIKYNNYSRHERNVYVVKQNTNNINAYISSVKYMFDIIFSNLLKRKKKKMVFSHETRTVAARTRVITAAIIMYTPRIMTVYLYIFFFLSFSHFFFSSLFNY